MLYAVLVSALLGVGALALERSFQLLRRPTRWVWAGAMLASALLPAGVWLWPGGRAVGSPGAGIEPALLAPLVAAAEATAERPGRTVSSGGRGPS